MSDSDDDVSSGSITDCDDIDEGEMEEEEVLDNENLTSDGEQDTDEHVDKRTEKYFQKEYWQIKKLPYYKEIEEQANIHFIRIKKGLADVVLLNDAATGFSHFVLELERYIDYYGRRFSKEEHIQLVQLLIPMITKGNIFRNVKIAIRAVTTLLNKRGFILREDLVIDWRPLYELYVEVTFKNLEEDGVMLLPENFRQDLHLMLYYARLYFKEESVQELLDECRPYMCVWDESCIRAWKLMEVFTCMNMPIEKQRVYGTALWFEEAWHWFESIDNNSLIDNTLMKMFMRISAECPGCIDWSGKMDLLFTRVLRSLRLALVNGLTQHVNLDYVCGWIVYMLGTACHDEIMSHLKHLFDQVEGFLHPSNYGTHTQCIIGFVGKVTTILMARVKRERNEAAAPNKPRTNPIIPEHMRLSQDQIDSYIKLILPLLKMIAFTKTSKELVGPTFRAAGLIAPKLILPLVLDMVYPALETLIEPHRLQQTLSTLLHVLTPLTSDQPGPDGKTYRIHVFTILNSLLPGLDCNDISKCMQTYQIIGVLINKVPLVDCSDAIHTRCDLTEDEKEICSATSNFDSIISMIMDRMCEMLIECGQTASMVSSHGAISAKNMQNLEDQILHRGTLSVFKGICRNSSTELFKVAMNKVYNFACEHVFDSKIVNEVLADMIQVSCKFHPEIAFSKFFKLILSRVQNSITPEFFTDEKVDFSVLWWLTLASKVVKVHPDYLINNWAEIRTLLDLVMPYKKCSIATEKCNAIYEFLLEQLTSIQLISMARRGDLFDLPSDQFLPVRHWSAPVDKKTWNPVWFVPTQESIDKATELIRDFFVPNVAILNSPQGVHKKEILHRLWLIRATILGACFSLPPFEGENLPLTESHTINQDEEIDMVVKPKGTPEIRIDGKNVRQMVLDCLLNLLDYLLENSPDDVKSIQDAVSIFKSLTASRGYSRELYTASNANYSVTKMMLCDKLAGNKTNIEMIVEEHILLLHRKRVSSVQGWHFKKQHTDILKMLLRVATSSYSQNRAKAQNILLGKLREHPYSYKYIVDDILYYLNPDNQVTHEQLKGALHLLIDGKKQAVCLRMEFEQQSRIWPALVGVRHSEKPSIIFLLESAQNLIVDNYESYRMKYDWPEACVVAAKNLLTAAEESSPLSDPQILKQPSDELLEKYKNHSLERFEKCKVKYHRLIDKLYDLAIDPNLHWRPIDMAHSMLSMLVRRDELLPNKVIKMYVRLLVHDSVKTRRIATAVVAACLKIMKPKAVKREYVIPHKEPNTGPGAKFPIKSGFREDNRIMMYEEDKLPKTDDEWNDFQFCGKQHWGVYTWPEKLITYAPLREQTAIDRSYEDFNETEKFIVDCFKDPQFMERFRKFFSLEMKKDEDTFNAVNFSLFQGLFRVLNDSLCGVFHEQLISLFSSTKESDQRLASEITAGIINGSKLWKYEKQKRMWLWLSPILSKNFETIPEDSLRSWGVAIATICGCSEARMLKPMIDLLFKLIERPTDNAFAASSRMFLVQSALCQFEWRGVELWNKLFGLLQTSLVHQYANLRERISVSLVSATWFDMPSVYVSPNLPPRLQPPKVSVVAGWYNEMLGPCWDEVRHKWEECASGPSIGSSSSDVSKNLNLSQSTSASTSVEISEVKKAARLAMKSTTSFVYNVCNQAYVALPQSVVPLLPLFFHYANDVGDEELSKSCHSFNVAHLAAIYVGPQTARLVLDTLAQSITSPCWWKAKVMALQTLRMIVFTNSFIFKHYRDEIGALFLKSMNDCQIEVREKAAEALSTMIQIRFFETTPQLVEKFSTASHSTDSIIAHAGVLGLSAIVRAFPYTVPPFLPDALMRICRFANSKNGTIRETVKRALSEFKRTHQDSWREHETQFNEDQLMVLRDLLISPNYYV
ncbi:unnamed protein product [Caenorhabditis bovis]|uniref:Proteasome activator complex subunit 4 n=1 Tax=Caenorhabditis bovis TaxID=2654633 RepID=A0A8S1EDW5_9PELO|nr:unnamed protein product [Caenorhabditis bovis]